MPFGFGRGRGRGRYAGRKARGIGRRGTGRARGIGRSENCLCPSCGAIVPHRTGFPCFQMNCPQCGTHMTRQFVAPATQQTVSQPFAGTIPKIDVTLCTGCGRCVTACPMDAITLVDKKAVINETICNGCRTCVPACPENAIT